MAQAGIGVDIFEIKRMERALNRHPMLAKRLFTEDERLYCEHTRRPAQHYAARFAAREAVLKALGCGFAEGVRFQDVSVARDAAGKPQVVLAGRAREIKEAKNISEIELSLSFTRDIAVANAICVSDDVRPQRDEKISKEDEIRASFKAARSILAELEQLQSEGFYLSSDTDESRYDEGSQQSVANS